MVRHSNVAGTFYEEDFDKLEKQIKECFYSELGPGDLPTKRKETRLKAAIVPHAGYSYSGPCAAWAYKKIGESEFPDAYIILAPNHHSNNTSLSIEDWKTPFGFVKSDKDLVREISEKTGVPINESFHNKEHSIEVQLPFLQFVSKDKLNNLKIVPMTLGHNIQITKFATDLAKAINESGKKIMILVSSDFTHYGTNFGYIPFEENPQQKIKEMDKKSIQLIKNKDVKGFLNHLEETQSTICGQVPIIILMQLLGEYSSELEMYYTSSEITGEKKNSVSYASITFK